MLKKSTNLSHNAAKGSVIIEFSIIAFSFCAIIFGTLDISALIGASQKAKNISYELANIGRRHVRAVLDTSDLDNILIDLSLINGANAANLQAGLAQAVTADLASLSFRAPGFRYRLEVYSCNPAYYHYATGAEQLTADKRHPPAIPPQTAFLFSSKNRFFPPSAREVEEITELAINRFPWSFTHLALFSVFGAVTNPKVTPTPSGSLKNEAAIAAAEKNYGTPNGVPIPNGDGGLYRTCDRSAPGSCTPMCGTVDTDTANFDINQAVIRVACLSDNPSDCLSPNMSNTEVFYHGVRETDSITRYDLSRIDQNGFIVVSEVWIEPAFHIGFIDWVLRAEGGIHASVVN